VTIHLLRHAKAGSRRAWNGPDEERPLSKAGRAQARSLAKRLSSAGVRRIYTSPFVRCRETVEPLHDRTGVHVEVADALAEGASLEESLRLVEKVLGEEAVLCTHGDVLANLLMHYAHLGIDLDDDRMEKASIWELAVVDGDVRAATYVAPPGT
jgi:8-oxo-dGTP diphosphatase